MSPQLLLPYINTFLMYTFVSQVAQVRERYSYTLVLIIKTTLPQRNTKVNKTL